MECEGWWIVPRDCLVVLSSCTSLIMPPKSKKQAKATDEVSKEISETVEKVISTVVNGHEMDTLVE